MAGYSGTPLPQKLGIKVGSAVRIINAPADFEESLGPLSEVRFVSEEVDVIVLFVSWRSELVAALDEAIAALAPRGGLWIAWPKRASKIPTDITEDVLREVILPTGLVDNKVCAISEVWSGLRFVRRRAS